MESLATGDQLCRRRAEVSGADLGINTFVIPSESSVFSQPFSRWMIDAYRRSWSSPYSSERPSMKTGRTLWRIRKPPQLYSLKSLSDRDIRVRRLESILTG